MLGTHTNFKFSVWVVSGFGLGFGFKEYSSTTTNTPKNYYYGSYLSQLEKNKKRVGEYKPADASSHTREEYGKEIKTGNISNVLNKFKQSAKEQEEEEKRLLELKK